jgi:hypothetical protein
VTPAVRASLLLPRISRYCCEPSDTSLGSLDFVSWSEFAVDRRTFLQSGAALTAAVS